MRGNWRALVGAAVGLGLAMLTGSAQAAERLALVIGNGGYANAPLANAVSDSRRIADALADTGFQVVHLIDADRREMRAAARALSAMKAAAGRGATTLFYFAGHGVQVDGRNYLIPIDADVREPADLAYDAVDARWVLDQIGPSFTGLSIVVLDACRDNPFPSATRGGPRGLAQMSAPAGALLAYATAPGTAAFDGDGDASPYSGALARAIREPGLKIEEVFKRVRRQVYAETDGKQVPWESSSLIGDFYFAGAEGPSVSASSLAAISSPSFLVPPTARPKSTQAPSPSFDCALATSPVERTICQAPELARADGALGLAYKQAHEGLSARDAARLRQRQRDWIRRRDAECVQRLGAARRLGSAPARRSPYVDCLLGMIWARAAFLRNY